jgi:hypothetical protein
MHNQQTLGMKGLVNQVHGPLPSNMKKWALLIAALLLIGLVSPAFASGFVIAARVVQAIASVSAVLV